jgi:hypothetical protein
MRYFSSKSPRGEDLWGWLYFNPNRRLTKCVLAGETIPFWRRLRFRFFDFFVKM